MANEDRLAWWRDARFGMFIHWGIYAVPAGRWKGEHIPWIGEWIMHRAQIPVSEYEQLAKQFNPVKFDAEEWVSLAADAGMKYLVITAKHHDGFAMYDSPSSDYDIVDATPYGRDPMKGLAEACARHGLKMCFYYSQAQDWHEPGGVGNTWDFGPDDQKTAAFARYLEDKVKPQLHELLTQYGPIGLIWFDTPWGITREQSLDLAQYVHSLQPDCLVSGRVGHDVGDYGSMGDNQIPAGRVEGDWETPATLNDTWGFKVDDDNWKSVETLLYLLCDLAAKGINYLLNVGPTAEGIIPEPSVERLRAIGRWMDVNGDAIYGTSASPFPTDFSWGWVTAKDDRLFLLVRDWRPELTLVGLRNDVPSAKLLGSGEAVSIEQTHDADLDQHTLTLHLPQAAPDEHVSVIELALSGAADIDTVPQQQADGSITLPAVLGELSGDIAIGRSGAVQRWNTTEPSIAWAFKVRRPGEFIVKALTHAVGHGRQWAGGHEVSAQVADQTVKATLQHDEAVDSPRAQYWPEAASHLGTVTLREPGEYRLEVRADAINADVHGGLALTGVVLQRRE